MNARQQDGSCLVDIRPACAASTCCAEGALPCAGYPGSGCCTTCHGAAMAHGVLLQPASGGRNQNSSFQWAQVISTKCWLQQQALLDQPTRLP